MSIEVTTVEDASEWNDHIRATRNGTAFHLHEALDVLTTHSDSDCHHLVGFKGNEPIGVFPVFTKQVGPITAAFSPPPNLKIPYLGPVFLNVQKLKRRRRELRMTRFVDAVVEWLEGEFDPAFTNIRTTPGYADVRPFIWQKYDAVPRYTYVVDLERDPDDLLAAFSSDARKNITGDYDVDYELATGGPEIIRKIVDQVIARHQEQEEPFPIDAEFAIALYDALPEGAVRPEYCSVDGEFVGGKIEVGLDDYVMNWLGGSKLDHDLPVNELVDWRSFTDAMDRGVAAYDLAGANDRRLSRYKSKYAPELTPYFRLENGVWGARHAASLYNRVK